MAREMSRDIRFEIIRDDGDFKRRVWAFTMTDSLRPTSYGEQIRISRRAAWRWQHGHPDRAPLMIDVPRDVIDEANGKALAVDGLSLSPEVCDLARHWACRTASSGPIELTADEREALFGWVLRRMARAEEYLRSRGQYVTEGSIALHVARDLRGSFAGRDGEPTLLAYDLCAAARLSASTR